MSEGKGKSVKLFLVDGSQGGLLTAEIGNWTGHVVSAPRSGIAELLARDESTRTGVYLLLGEEEGSPVAYIGESDVIGERLRSHARPESGGGKDFWDRAILLTSKDPNLTKAHARYLETRFLLIAEEAGRVKLQNENKGTSLESITLPEADRSDMEQYISHTRVLLPVLGVNVFRTKDPGPSSSAVSSKIDRSPIFEYTVKRHNIQAQAQEIDGEFTVLRGSTARDGWTSSWEDYRPLYEKLKQEKVLGPRGEGLLVFTRDYVFTSPSAAAAIVAGRSANGRTSWKVPGSGMTYGEWQARDIPSGDA